MRHDALWWKVFRTWFYAAMLFYDFSVLPVVVAVAYYSGHGPALLSYGLAALWALASTVGASAIGRLAAYLADTRAEDLRSINPYSRFGVHGVIINPRTRMGTLQESIERGQKWMLYANPPGLAYVFVVRILWRRILARICFVCAAVWIIMSPSKKPKKT